MEVRESVWQWHANRCGSRIEVRRVVCELWWTKLTTYGVSASLEVVICQMHEKEMICPPGDGLENHVRCGGWIRQLYAEMIK